MSVEISVTRDQISLMLSYFLGEEQEDGVEIVWPSTKLSLEGIGKDGRTIRCSNVIRL